VIGRASVLSSTWQCGKVESSTSATPTRPGLFQTLTTLAANFSQRDGFQQRAKRTTEELGEGRI
jgi:hypothetical protein